MCPGTNRLHLDMQHCFSVLLGEIVDAVVGLVDHTVIRVGVLVQLALTMGAGLTETHEGKAKGLVRHASDSGLH